MLSITEGHVQQLVPSEVIESLAKTFIFLFDRAGKTQAFIAI